MNSFHKGFIKSVLFGLPERREIYSIMLAYARDDVPIITLIEGRFARLEAKNDLMAPMYEDLLKKYKAGRNMADVFKEWIPAGEYAVMLGAVETGKVVLGLDSLCKQVDGLYKVKRILRKGLLGPIVLSLIFVVVVFALAGWLVPYIRESIESAVSGTLHYGLYEKSVFAVSDFIASNMVLLVVGLIGGVWLSFFSLSRWTSGARKYFEKIPPWSIYKMFTSSGFIIYIGSMVRADRPLLSALNGIRDSSTPYVRHYVDTMIKQLNDGRVSQMEAMNVGLMDPATVDLLTDFSKTSSFDTAILAVGDTSLEKTMDMAESLTARIASMLQIAILLTVGFFIGGIMLVIFGAMNAMG